MWSRPQVKCRTLVILVWVKVFDPFSVIASHQRQILLHCSLKHTPLVCWLLNAFTFLSLLCLSTWIFCTNIADLDDLAEVDDHWLSFERYSHTMIHLRCNFDTLERLIVTVLTTFDALLDDSVKLMATALSLVRYISFH